jgi:putative phosphoribosyl transferase
MDYKTSPNIIELPELHDRTRVFRNRQHAGEVLAGMLSTDGKSDAIVLAIPAGGVPVAVPIAERLHIPLDVAVVSKITLPWNTEAGYGAVAFDKTMHLNEDFLPRLGLTEEEIQQGIDQTTKKVLRRAKKFRGDWPFPDLSKHSAILVDDGLASGFTLLVAVQALRNAGARHVCVAIPTAYESSLQRVAPEVEAVYCANIRGGLSFAVADAYAQWADVAEEEAIALYRRLSPHD